MPRQANLARAVRHFDIHPLDESVTIGLRLFETRTSGVVDAHLAVVAVSEAFRMALRPRRPLSLGEEYSTGFDRVGWFLCSRGRLVTAATRAADGSGGQFALNGSVWMAASPLWRVTCGGPVP